MCNVVLFKKAAVCQLVVAIGCLTAIAEADEVAGGHATTVANAVSSRMIDLTHSFDAKTIYWPTAEGFKLTRGPAGVTEKGYYYSANQFAAAEHGGTHLDAPIHFAEDGQTVDQIPLDRLIGEAAVIDVETACQNDSNYLVGIADLRRWEQQHKRPLVDVIVLLRTGYSRHWSNRKKYLGTDRTGPEAVAELRFPGLDPEAAQWLVDHREIKAIGIDTASIDYGQSTHFESHVALAKHGIPIFENVAHLEKLPATSATVIALPMKIGDGSGAPLRILAQVPVK